jgi:ABC-type Fe3+ transport system permease subunit
MVMALILAAILFLIAVFSLYWQIENLRGLRKPNIPSNDRRYRRNQAVLRLINGSLLLILAAMISGTFLSGIEQRAAALGSRHDEKPREGEEPAPITEEDKAFLNMYSIYWASVMGLLFIVVSVAIVDLWSTRRYAWAQLRRMRDEHRALLERDLAVYRQQKLNNRIRNAE